MALDFAIGIVPMFRDCLIPLFAGECRKPGYRPKNSKNNVYTLKMTLKFLTIDEFKLYQPATNHIEPPIP